jgi:FAD/FMN-containing dehydrogenase
MTCRQRLDQPLFAPAAWQSFCYQINMGLLPDHLITELRTLLGSEYVIDRGDALETLSKDFYWYSPILKPLLENKRADLVVRPGSMDQLRATIATCFRAKVPVVPRGAGTGNYGQCVPLFGGVVLDLARLDRILEITPDGVVRAEPGARLGTIETEARQAGWELRCMPSTWVKSSLAGFFCGGSGGIGSITWGGINAPGNVKSVTLLSCEETPRLIRLEEADCKQALHTYGTTGIMVEIEMRLAPKVDYAQLILSSPDWDRLLDWTDATARRLDWRKRLVTQFEWPTPSFFKPLKKYFRPDEHVTFLLVDRAQAAAVLASAETAGLGCVFQAPLADPPKPPFITDYTWNHTTLWAIKADPAFTYLQSGFAPNFREQFAALRARFPGEILFHLEWTAGNAKMMRGNAVQQNADAIVVGGIPLVYFKSVERLNEILAACAELNVFIANPHTFYLEEGGRHPNIADKRALKASLDPSGLLNPGKMKTYPHNPFAPAA